MISHSYVCPCTRKCRQYAHTHMHLSSLSGPPVRSGALVPLWFSALWYHAGQIFRSARMTPWHGVYLDWHLVFIWIDMQHRRRMTVKMSVLEAVKYRRLGFLVKIGLFTWQCAENNNIFFFLPSVYIMCSRQQFQWKHPSWSLPAMGCWRHTARRTMARYSFLQKCSMNILIYNTEIISAAPQNASLKLCAPLPLLLFVCNDCRGGVQRPYWPGRQSVLNSVFKWAQIV